jgi:stalled ribosome rescue protein Dom34
VLQAILRHINFDVVKAVLIASPGFVRQQFFDYMYQQVSFSTILSLQIVILCAGCEI